MAHLGILRWPAWSLGGDIRIAIELACRHPERVSVIIASGAELPARTPKHDQRMTKWSRFVAANARHAPRAMRYIALAFFSLARRVGQKQFVQLVMGSSTADLRMIEDEEVYAAMLRGSGISVSPSFTSHEAWAAEIVANLSKDWSERFRRCPAPILLFHGVEDPFSPIETVREYASEIPGLTLVEYQDRGQLLYREWPDMSVRSSSISAGRCEGAGRPGPRISVSPRHESGITSASLSSAFA